MAGLRARESGGREVLATGMRRNEERALCVAGEKEKKTSEEMVWRGKKERRRGLMSEREKEKG
jgi:hypothetical protein